MNSKVHDFQDKESSQYDWELQKVVEELRANRVQSLVVRQRVHRPPKLPSRKEITQILDGLNAALFPNRLGMPGLTTEGIDYFVGHTLDVALRSLSEQVALDLACEEARELEPATSPLSARAITQEFALSLPAIRQVLETDIRAAFEGDPAARDIDEVLVCYPGVRAIIHHRLAHGLWKLGARLLARIISDIAHSSTAVDIHPGAQIGESFFIDHGTGVVIGETAIIGKGVRLYQAVTLGAKRFPEDENGVLIKGNARHPIVEDDVVIYAGATILGRITIGKGSTIGGNVWITRSVPAGSNITQGQNRSQGFEDGVGI
jgi:serine O-acetyltransferase